MDGSNTNTQSNTKPKPVTVIHPHAGPRDKNPSTTIIPADRRKG